MDIGMVITVTAIIAAVTGIVFGMYLERVQWSNLIDGGYLPKPGRGKVYHE